MKIPTPIFIFGISIASCFSISYFLMKIQLQNFLSLYYCENTFSEKRIFWVIVFSQSREQLH